MISKLNSVIGIKNIAKIPNKCKTAHSYFKSEIRLLSEKKTVVNSELKSMSNILLNKVKNIRKNISEFVNKFFTEEGKSKIAGIEPLKGKEREKFIKETSIYDPNSPDYIHANYNIPKKSK